MHCWSVEVLKFKTGKSCDGAYEKERACILTNTDENSECDFETFPFHHSCNVFHVHKGELLVNRCSLTMHFHTKNVCLLYCRIHLWLYVQYNAHFTTFPLSNEFMTYLMNYCNNLWTSSHREAFRTHPGDTHWHKQAYTKTSYGQTNMSKKWAYYFNICMRDFSENWSKCKSFLLLYI